VKRLAVALLAFVAGVAPALAADASPQVKRGEFIVKSGGCNAGPWGITFASI